MGIGQGQQVASIFAKVGADTSGLTTGLAQADGQIQGFGSKLASIGPMVGLAVGAAAIGVGVALFKIGADFDAAYDKIRIGTGATGEVLEGLKDDMKGVFSSIPTDVKSAGTAIADLNTRLGLTGKPLREMSAQMLELSRITKTDLATNIQQGTRVFGDWGVAVKDQAKTMDLLFRASQSTGISIQELMSKIVQFGAPLRAMDFSVEESAAMLGKWEKEGVNTELVLGSLRIAMGHFAKANVPMRDGLNATIKEIQRLGPSAAATSLAMETFGARAGPDMAAAILEGRFAFEDLLATIQGGSDTIVGVGKETMDASEKFTILKNRAMLAIEPLSSGLFNAVGRLMDKFDEWGPSITAVTDKFGPLLDTAGRFADALKRIFSGTADWGSFTQAVKDTFGPDAQHFMEEFIGRIQDIAKFINEKLGPPFEKMKEWFAKITENGELMNAVLAGVAVAIGVGLVVGVVAATVALWGMAAAVIAATWPILAIIAVVAGAVLLWQNWGKVTGWLGDRFTDFKEMLRGVWTWVNNLIDALGPFEPLVLGLLGPIGWVVAAFRHWNDITGWVGNLIEMLQRLIEVAKNLPGVKGLSDLAGAAGGFGGNLLGGAGGAIGGALGDVGASSNRSVQALSPLSPTVINIQDVHLRDRTEIAWFDAALTARIGGRANMTARFGALAP